MYKAMDTSYQITVKKSDPQALETNSTVQNEKPYRELARKFRSLASVVEQKGNTRLEALDIIREVLLQDYFEGRLVVSYICKP